MYLIFGIALLLGGLLTINSIFSYQSKHIDPAFLTTLWFQFKMIPLVFAANMMIGYGVKFSYKTTGNLTFSLGISKGIEIFICVLMGYIFLKEIPSWKTYAGLTVVVLGFVITRWK
ncbi:hypothetical protein [Paenibacillus sp. FJAT-26967]|uniref:hypothetical protein n=1 Tax=Paenibacillus sp. FJAT-26967 TaxID=1729690 RepID=UPI000838EA5C|nr:hypothetical protein [Paenibacillus sp. FJAT-26967]